MELFSHVFFFLHADHVSEKYLLSFLSHKHVVVVVVVVVVYPFLPVVLLCRPWNQIMCHSTSISGLILCSVINRGDERL